MYTFCQLQFVRGKSESIHILILTPTVKNKVHFNNKSNMVVLLLLQQREKD